MAAHSTPIISRIVRSLWFGALALAMLLSRAGASAQGLDFGGIAARPVPGWLPKASIYELWPSMFSKEGNLRGAIAGLHNVAELGATIVYLGPIAKRAGSAIASPYSIADYNQIDPEAGTDQDLRDFVTAAHRLGLKVMLDIVYYHTAPDNVLLARDPSLFVKNGEGKIVQGFWPQPLPDFQNPKMRKYLIDSLVHWVRDFDVDGFRCDVGAGVPVAFWNEAREALDPVKPDVVMLSESDRPDDQFKAFDINYNFQHYLALRDVLRDGEPAEKLRTTWEMMHRTMPEGARLLHYSDNHDWPRAVVQFGQKGALAASVLNFTLDGIPFLFNGQEVNDPDPTSWRTVAPIRWPVVANEQEQDSPAATRTIYRRLFQLRSSEPAIYSGDVVWINNSAPDSVLSFLRRTKDSEVLVIVNLSNRKVHVTLDLPVMEYYVVDNLLAPGRTWFQLYSGRVSADLGAYGYVVGRKVPHPPLKD